MSPRWEISGERNLAVSDWHRHAFDDDAAAFDLDLVGMCRRCNAHLYCIESTRANQKATTWTTVTAQRLNCPGILIQYTTDPIDDTKISTARGRIVHPQRVTSTFSSLDEIRVWMQLLRDHHEYLWHRNFDFLRGA